MWVNWPAHADTHRWVSRRTSAAASARSVSWACLAAKVQGVHRHRGFGAAEAPKLTDVPGRTSRIPARQVRSARRLAKQR